MYGFENLKKFLATKGIIVDKKSNYQLIRAKIGREEFENNKIEFSEHGIYYIDEYGVKHQGYMHQFDYLVERYGTLPRFHILPCRTLLDFKRRGKYNAYYRFSNSPTETVTERSDKTGNTIYENVELQLCGFCRNMLRELQLEEYATTKEFVKSLGTSSTSSTNPSKADTLEVDMHGYVKNWWRISKLIKFNRDYICEECGVDLSSSFHNRFCEVHHVDGNKQNNSDNNLRCLCIRCHSEVDSIHESNYAKGANKLRLNHFIEEFMISPKYSKK